MMILKHNENKKRPKNINMNNTAPQDESLSRRCPPVPPAFGGPPSPPGPTTLGGPPSPVDPHRLLEGVYIMATFPLPLNISKILFMRS